MHMWGSGGFLTKEPTNVFAKCFFIWMLKYVQTLQNTYKLTDCDKHIYEVQWLIYMQGPLKLGP